MRIPKTDTIWAAGGMRRQKGWGRSFLKRAIKWKSKHTSEYQKSYKWNTTLHTAILTAKQASWQAFVNSMNANTLSSTVWKRLSYCLPVKGKSRKKIIQVKNENVWLRIWKVKTFNDHYKCRAGQNVSWPKLTHSWGNEIIS